MVNLLLLHHALFEFISCVQFWHLYQLYIFKRYVESGYGSTEFHVHVKGGDSAYTPSDQVNELLPLDTKWKVYKHSVFLQALSYGKC
jgi:hypothetical protein